jgi:hypothetical protein
MADNHPIFAETLGHMPATYLQVFDLLSQFVHLFEDDSRTVEQFSTQGFMQFTLKFGYKLWSTV